MWQSVGAHGGTQSVTAGYLDTSSDREESAPLKPAPTGHFFQRAQTVTLHRQLVALFEEVSGVGEGGLKKEVCHWKLALSVHSLAPLQVLSLFCCR